MNWTELIIKSTFLEMREQTPYVWRLRSSGTQGEPEGLLWLVASATFYGGVCWGSSVGLLTGGDITDWVRRPALSWDGPLHPVEVVGERRAMAKLWSVMDNTSHFPEWHLLQWQAASPAVCEGETRLVLYNQPALDPPHASTHLFTHVQYQYILNCAISIYTKLCNINIY